MLCARQGCATPHASLQRNASHAFILQTPKLHATDTTLYMHAPVEVADLIFNMQTPQLLTVHKHYRNKLCKANKSLACTCKPSARPALLQ